MDVFESVDCFNLSDEDLVCQINSGNDDMLQVLVSRYQPIIKIKATEISKSYEIDIEDLVQEGLIALFSAVKVYNPEVSLFSTFASLCIKRGLLSVCRNQYRKKHIPREKLVYSDAEIDSSAVKSPEALLIEKEESFLLTEKIKQILSPLEYKVLLAFIVGNSYDDISRSLDITVKSVNNTMCRVRRKIKEIY